MIKTNINMYKFIIVRVRVQLNEELVLEVGFGMGRAKPAGLWVGRGLGQYRAQYFDPFIKWAGFIPGLLNTGFGPGFINRPTGARYNFYQLHRKNKFKTRLAKTLVRSLFKFLLIYTNIDNNYLIKLIGLLLQLSLFFNK